MNASDQNPPGGASGVRATTVLDAGKLKRKTIKALKRGKGRIMEQVDEIANEASATADGRTLLRLVILVQKQPRRRG